MMENKISMIKCFPFSDAAYLGQRRCCPQMTLVSALKFSLKCQTCLLRQDCPDEAAPILLNEDECLNEHFANNHVIICLICAKTVFHEIWSRQKANLHVTDCITRALYNTSRPFVCTRCLQTVWFREN